MKRIALRGAVQKQNVPKSEKVCNKLRLKMSSTFELTPLKDALKVQFSMLNRAENASMAPHYHPQMRR